MHLTAEDATREMNRRKFIRTALRNHRFFCKHIIDKPPRPHFMDDHWESIYDDPFLNDVFDHHRRNADFHGDLVLISRGYLKSTIFTINDPLRLVLRDPDNVRIAIFSHNEVKAQGFVAEIRNIVERNEKIRQYFGEHVGGPVWDNFNKSRRWSNKELDFIQKNPRGAQPNISGHSINNIPTGDHFTHFIFDDCITEENSHSRERVESINEQIGLAFGMKMEYMPSKRARDEYGAVKSAGGLVRFVGTRYAELDYYAQLLKSLPPSKVIVRSCWADKEQTVPAFKSKATRESLEEQKAGMHNNFVWACQYLMHPYDEEQMKFRDHFFRHLPYKDFPEFTESAISVDPSMCRSASADDIGVCAGGTDGSKIYIVHGFRVRMDPTLIIDGLIDICVRFKIWNIIAEDQGFQFLLKLSWESKIKEWEDRLSKERGRKIVLPIQIFGAKKLTNVSKSARIMGMLTPYEGHNIIHVDDLKGGALEEELLRFNPKKDNNEDNIIDAEQQLIQQLSDDVDFSSGDIATVRDLEDHEIGDHERKELEQYFGIKCVDISNPDELMRRLSDSHFGNEDGIDPLMDVEFL